MKNLRISMLVIIISSATTLFSSHAGNNDYLVPVVSPQSIPTLGSAFDSKRNNFGCEVVTGETTCTGIQQSGWKKEVNLSSAKKASLINGSANIEINYGIFSGSGGMSLDLVKKNTKHSYSETLWFDVVGKDVKLSRPQIHPLYESSRKTKNAKDIFGDKFVNSIKLGARLLLDIQIEFDENIDTTKVSGNVNIGIAKVINGAAEANVELDEIVKNSSIKISAKQLGGNASKLTGIFGNGDHVMRCGAGHYDRCVEVIKEVFTYSRDFGEQLKECKFEPNGHAGAGLLSYTLADYKNAKLEVFLDNHVIMDHQTARLQSEMTQNYYSLIEDIKYIDSRLKRAVGNEKKELQNARKSINKDIGLIVGCINESDRNPDTTQAQYDRYQNNKEFSGDVTDIPTNEIGPYTIITCTSFKPLCIAIGNKTNNPDAKIGDYIIEGCPYQDCLAQKFTFKALDNSDYAIFTLGSHVLTAESQNNGAWVKPEVWQDKATQHWAIPNLVGFTQISLKNSPLKLTVDANKRLKITNHNGDHFILGGGDEFIREDVSGPFTIVGKPVLKKSFYISVDEQLNGEGCPLIGSAYEDTINKKFSLVKLSNGDYAIITCLNKVLTISSFSNEASVVQKCWTGGAEQQWKLNTQRMAPISISDGNNTFYLKVPTENEILTITSDKFNRFCFGKGNEHENESL